MKTYSLVFVILILALRLPAQPNEPVRLALVSETDEAAAAVDVLTAQLSGDARIHLLERDEIAKVYREQGLSAGNRDYLKLGQILGADGLLILHLSKEMDPQRLSVRLVAVKPGATLRQSEYPWPLNDQPQWAMVVVAQFQPLFAKLSVLPKEAVPISILNLRSSVASVAGETLERELTELLYARLANERDLFVLERRSLGLLADENQFNEAEESAFWNGSYLLEGAIDKARYDKDTVTIEARLTPPESKQVLTVEVSGARTNLPGVVNELAVKLLAVLKREGAAAEWNPSAEAERYSAEAGWMLKWGMSQEAKSAGDAAWALGKQTREAAELRIKAYQACAGDPGFCVTLNEDRRVVFGQEINPNVASIGQIAAYASAPGPGQFADIVRAEELYLDAFRSFAAPAQKLDPAWLNLGETLLDQTSMWLRYYYFTTGARPGQEAKIEDAKTLCLAITKMVESHPDFASADADYALLAVKARNLAFWVDAPEQCLPIYRAFITTGQWPLVRRRFLNASYEEVSAGYMHTPYSDAMGRSDKNDQSATMANPANPCLAGWTWAGRERIPDIWNGFIGELCGSSDPLVSLEGRVLRCSYSWSDADFDRNLNQLLDYLREQRDPILSAGLAGQLLDDLRVMVNQRAEEVTEKHPGRVQGQTWLALERELKTPLIRPGAAGAQFPETPNRRLKLAEKKNYLNTQTNFDMISFVQTLLAADYRPEEARELLPLVTNYAVRIKGTPPVDTGDHAAFMRRRLEQRQAAQMIDSFKIRLTNAISPPPPYKAAVPPSPRAVNPPPARAVLSDIPPPQILSNATPAPPAISALEIGHFWSIPTPDGLESNKWDGEHYLYRYNGESYVPHLAACCYRDGRLWVEARFDPFDYKGHVEFWGIDLETLNADVVRYDGEDFSQRGSFEIHGGFLYFSLGNAIRRYSFEKHSWEQFVVPASGGINPVRLGDRLFFTSSSSILEYAADGSFHTLASTRRQPPMTSLDSVEAYNSPHLFLTTDGALHFRTGNDIYAFLTGSNDWRHIASLAAVDNQHYYSFEDGFVAWCGQPAECWGMLGHSAAPKFLARPDPFSGSASWNKNRDKNGPSPRWESHAPGIELCTQGDSLWFLTGTPNFTADDSHQLQVQPIQGTNPALVCFAPGETQPLTVPVRFKPDGIILLPDAARMQTKPYYAPWERNWGLQWTPRGMVMIRNSIPGFWFIPAQDLEAALRDASSRQHLELQAASEAANVRQEQSRAKLLARNQQWRTELLAAYDQNHNGVFEPDEKEAMIDDSRYLELELPVIDANTNGLLDASELRFFDANANGRLEPREKRAIDVTLSMLAEKLLAKLNPDADGKIDPSNLPEGLSRSSGVGRGVPANFRGAGPNAGALIGKDELVTLLRRHLVNGLRIDGKPVIPVISQETLVNPEMVYQARIEEYWRLSRAQTNPPGLPAASEP